MLPIVNQVFALTLLSTAVYSLLRVAIGYLFVFRLGLHDPWPRTSEFGSLLRGLSKGAAFYFGFYFLGLILAWSAFNALQLDVLVVQGAVLALLSASIHCWYNTPRDHSLTGELLVRVVFVVGGVYFSTLFMALLAKI